MTNRIFGQVHCLIRAPVLFNLINGLKKKKKKKKKKKQRKKKQKPSVLKANSENAASDLGIHCLLMPNFATLGFCGLFIPERQKLCSTTSNNNNNIINNNNNVSCTFHAVSYVFVPVLSSILPFLLEAESISHSYRLSPFPFYDLLLSLSQAPSLRSQILNISVPRQQYAHGIL